MGRPRMIDDDSPVPSGQPSFRSIFTQPKTGRMPCQYSLYDWFSSFSLTIRKSLELLMTRSAPTSVVDNASVLGYTGMRSPVWSLTVFRHRVWMIPDGRGERGRGKEQEKSDRKLKTMREATLLSSDPQQRWRATILLCSWSIDVAPAIGIPTWSMILIRDSNQLMNQRGRKTGYGGLRSRCACYDGERQPFATSLA